MTDERYLFLLDSADCNADLGRYSIVAWMPGWEFTAKEGSAWFGRPGDPRACAGDVLGALGRVMEGFAGARLVRDSRDGDPPPVFTGGALGFLAYELLHEIETLPPNDAEDLDIADCHLLFCDLALVTDQREGRSWLVANGWGDSEASAREDCARKRRIASAACAAPRGGEAAPAQQDSLVDRLCAEDLARCDVAAATEPDRYMRLVERAREHILAGDVFELCLTQRFDTTFAGSGIDLYDCMRQVNPAPMGAYLRFPRLEVLSCSPERFLRVDTERWVETRPIKGTRPRGRTRLEDEALAIDLGTALKDSAENTMIVDLARNDLGRVCEFGTVEVPSLRAVERYASVFQLVSTVRGRLREDVTIAQLLEASFPGGSMTGAPKVEAMRLINLLEDSRRGIFSGALGYMSYSGEIDLSIVIRTVIKRGEGLFFHTGGAVTSDSTPTSEYQETLDKACAIVRAIELARLRRDAGASEVQAKACPPQGEDESAPVAVDESVGAMVS
ncbi:MAG: anthranilate synthase component I family protein [Solirubrobacteraceae bacterium]